MYFILGFRKITLKDGAVGYHVFLGQNIPLFEGEGSMQCTRVFLKQETFDEQHFEVGESVTPELGTDKDGHLYVRNLVRKEV